MKKRRIKMRWREEEKNGRVGWHDTSGSSSGFPSCFSKNSFSTDRLFERFGVSVAAVVLTDDVYCFLVCPGLMLLECCSCKGNVWVLWYDMMIHKLSFLLGGLLCCKQYRKPCNVVGKQWKWVSLSKKTRRDFEPAYMLAEDEKDNFWIW